jgi:hypothetical protein
MTGESLVCQCGEPLAEDVNTEGVVTVEGTALSFRRRTDYVMCGMCLRFYRLDDLRDGRVVPLTLTEIKFLNELEDTQEGGDGTPL